MTSPTEKSTDRRLRRRRDTPPQASEPAAPAAFPGYPFFSFTYTSQELRLGGGQTEVKARRVELRDGRLQSEQFEGVLPPEAFAQAGLAMQRMIADQAALMLKQFGALLPFAPHAPRRDRKD